MSLDGLSPELQEKARACATTEELLELAKLEGIELPEDELDGLSGGWDECDTKQCARVSPYNVNPT